MKAFETFRFIMAHPAKLVSLCTLPLILLALNGCGDVEGTDTSSATCTLNPSASYNIRSSYEPEDIAVSTTNFSGGTTVIVTNVSGGVTSVTTQVEGRTTNVTTTLTPGDPAITRLSLSATTSGDTSWSVQASDNNGGTYSGTATGPAVWEPTSGNTYSAGSTVATFSLQCAGLSGEISAIALAPIPMNVVRTSTTNGTNVVVGRIGQHTLTSQNTEYRLSATASTANGAVSLSGSAPITAATIDW